MPASLAKQPYTSRPKSNISMRSRNSNNSARNHLQNQTFQEPSKNLDIFTQKSQRQIQMSRNGPQITSNSFNREQQLIHLQLNKSLQTNLELQKKQFSRISAESKVTQIERVFSSSQDSTELRRVPGYGEANGLNELTSPQFNPNDQQHKQYNATIDEDDEFKVIPQRYSLQGSSNNLENKNRQLPPKSGNSVFKNAISPNKKPFHQQTKSLSLVQHVAGRPSMIDESNKSNGSSENSGKKSTANYPNLPNISNASSNYGFKVGKFPDVKASPSKSSKKVFQSDQRKIYTDRQFKTEVSYQTPQITNRKFALIDQGELYTEAKIAKVVKQESEPLKQKILLESINLQPHEDLEQAVHLIHQQFAKFEKEKPIVESRTQNIQRISKAQTNVTANNIALEIANNLPLQQCISEKSDEIDNLRIQDDIKVNDIQKELFENTSKQAFVVSKPIVKSKTQERDSSRLESCGSWLLVPSGLREGDENVRDSIVANDTQRSNSQYQRFSTLENQSQQNFQVKNRIGSNIQVLEVVEQERASDSSAFEDNDLNDRKSSEGNDMEDLFTKNLNKSRMQSHNPVGEKEKKSDDSDVISSKSLENQFNNRNGLTTRNQYQGNQFKIDATKYFSKSEFVQPSIDTKPEKNNYSTNNQESEDQLIDLNQLVFTGTPDLRNIDKKSPISISVTPVDSMVREEREPPDISFFFNKKRGMTLKVKKDDGDSNNGFNSVTNSNNFNESNRNNESNSQDTRKTLTTRGQSVLNRYQIGQQKKNNDQIAAMQQSIVGLKLSKFGNSIDMNNLSPNQKHWNFNRSQNFNKRFQVQSKKLHESSSNKKILKKMESHEQNILQTQINIDNDKMLGITKQRSHTCEGNDETLEDEADNYRSTSNKSEESDMKVDIMEQQQFMIQNQSLTSIKEDEESQIPINPIHLNHMELEHKRDLINRQTTGTRQNLTLKREQLEQLRESESQTTPITFDAMTALLKDNELLDASSGDRRLMSDALAATKGTQFQSSMKFLENLEVKDDQQQNEGIKKYLETQPINRSLQFIKISNSSEVLKDDYVKILETEEDQPMDSSQFVGRSGVKQPFLETFGKDLRISNINQIFNDSDLNVAKKESYLHDDFNSQEDIAEGHAQTLQAAESYIDQGRNLPDQSRYKQGILSMIKYTHKAPYQQTQPLLAKKKATNIEDKIDSINDKIFEFQRVRTFVSKRLFDMFYVVGITEDDLEHLVTDFQDQSQDDSNICSYNSVSAKQIFSYPERPDDAQIQKRTNVIQDFAFPNGVKCRQLNSQNKQQNQAYLRQLLQEIPKNRKNTYVFTLDANDQDPGIDSYFNILCVKFDTVMKRKSDGELFIVEHAFCMLSRSSLFQAQFDAIDTLLQVINHNQRIASYREQSAQNLIDSFLMIDYQNDQTYVSIKKLHEHVLPFKGEDKYPYGFEFNIQVETYVQNEEIMNEKVSNPYRYQVPSSFFNCYAFSFNWHVPVLLSLFCDFRIIMKLITAVMLERSVIFISENPAKLSSAILGIKSMIKPFSWCNTQIPVLPGDLLQIIDSPFPIIVGITKESYLQLLEDYYLESELVESNTWVYLDQVDASDRQSKLQTTFSEKQQSKVEWCQGSDAVKYEDYLWYREYSKLGEITNLHLEFLSMQSRNNEMGESFLGLDQNDDVHFELSDQQHVVVQKIHFLYNEMIQTQILKFINIERIKHLYSQVRDESVETIFERIQKEVLNELDSYTSQSVDNELTIHRLNSLRPPNLVQMKKSDLYNKSSQRTAGTQLTQRPGQEQQIFSPLLDDASSNESGQDIRDIGPFLESLIQTQSFAQLIEDLVKTPVHEQEQQQQSLKK